MLNNINKAIRDRWNKTRSGAWAGRGFQYQHLFSTLVLIRQWAGLAPSGYLVPEGLEDCVVESSECDFLIQIKSKGNGTFSEGEVKGIFEELRQKATLIGEQKATQLIVGIERPCSAFPEQGVDSLFNGETEKVIVCGEPEKEIIGLLLERLKVAEITAEGLANDLYKLVAGSAAANASLPFEKRRRISTTEIERRIFERLEAEDPSAIDHALSSRALEPVDFVTPVSEPGFYQGVKVKPGHVAYGLVLDRPTEIQKIIRTLRNRRHLLIVGPSGAGKSALMWLVANSLSGEVRWYQVSARAGPQDVDAIVRFVRAHRPGEISPIGLAFDEVGGANSDLWNVLVRELRGLPDVYFLGSVRNEDLALIANQSDTELFEISLDENLAQSVWTKLANRSQTNWAHWREPFEQSEGLMLEYTHLLTQGKRLAAVIDEQVRQREREERQDELAILRNTAVLCALGGEVKAKELFELLELPSDRASQALRRLIDEHLVRESRPGVLGGLHTLRSKALTYASHDKVVYLRTDSLWRSLPSVTNETLPRVVQSVLAEEPDKNEAVSLQKLAETLATSDDIEVWSAILTGLGLGTLERYVASFIAVLEQHQVRRAQWSLASMFMDPGVDLSGLSKLEPLKNLLDAVAAFRALPKRDLRSTCLELLPEESRVPVRADLQQANQFLSCLVPVAGGEPIKIPFEPRFTDCGEQNIQDVASLLSTASLLGPNAVESLVAAFGGEQTLLSQFYSQTPWTTAPTIEPEGDYGRIVRANWFLVAENHQSDPHEAVCNICETLIALSPLSNAAASDAIDPAGQSVTIGDYSFYSKNIPRENLPAKARVAWNVAFRQILLARIGSDRLTEYTQQMGHLVSQAEKVFRLFSEKWIKSRRISNKDALASEVNKIIEQINALTYTTPETPASSMISPASNAGMSDTLGALLTDVLRNLAPRMGKISAGSNTKAAATFADDLAARAREHEQSKIWRATASPPLKELTALAERLDNVAAILHEMAHDGSPTATERLIKAAKKGNPGKAVRSAARLCRSFAEQRFRKRLRTLEEALKIGGWTAKCWTRPVDESDNVYWPAMEVAILVDVTDFEIDAGCLDDCLSVGQDHLVNDWRFRVAPVISGQVVASLTLFPSLQGSPLPDMDFAKKWQDHIDLPFLSSEILEAFDAAVAACTQISAIVNCRDLANLHPEEEDIFLKVIDSFKSNREIVETFAKKKSLEEFIDALAYLDESWNQAVDEFEAAKTGLTISNPLWMIPYQALAGEGDEKTLELAAIRILLLQAECRVNTEVR